MCLCVLTVVKAFAFYLAVCVVCFHVFQGWFQDIYGESGARAHTQYIISVSYTHLTLPTKA